MLNTQIEIQPFSLFAISQKSGTTNHDDALQEG